MSIFKRIMQSLFAGIFMFIILAVVEKLFIENPQWLITSAIWAVAWAVGSFIGKVFCNFNTDHTTVVILNIGIIALVTLILFFITGVLMNCIQWKSVIAEIMFPFGMALMVNSRNNTPKNTA